jgi:N-glycosylase/DNA lyase
MTEALLSEYGKRKKAIKKRLLDFDRVWMQPEKRIFSELCFCICTPQSKAVYCDKAVTALDESGKLFTGGEKEIRDGLKAVRFPNNKARYIVEARNLFSEGGSLSIKPRINVHDVPAARDWIVKNVKGLGYKEASHFLRNTGHGKDLAILDVHILKNMKRYGEIKEIPECISKKCYFSLEGKMRGFSDRIGIPMAELDLLLWSMETGVIFK